MPLQRIHRLLERERPSRSSLSNNPGRYLCNQVLYVALEYLEFHAIPCRAGFIHLPLAADYPTGRAADALAQVITELRRPDESYRKMPPAMACAPEPPNATSDAAVCG